VDVPKDDKYKVGPNDFVHAIMSVSRVCYCSARVLGSCSYKLSVSGPRKGRGGNDAELSFDCGDCL